MGSCCATPISKHPSIDRLVFTHLAEHDRSTAHFVAACAQGDVQSVRTLLELRGAEAVDVHAHNSDAFVAACANGHLPVVRELLALRGQRRIRVHAQGDAALLRTCEAGHTGVVRALLQLRGEQGFDMTLLGPTSLRAAVRGGHKATLRYLLGKTGSWLADAPEWAEGQPLLIACSRGHTELVRYMLTLKGPLSADVTRGNFEAFFAACRAGHLPVVREMLQLTGERAIDLNAGTAYTVFHLYPACSSALLRTLLDVTGPGAYRNTSYVGRHSLLEAACKAGDHETLDVMLAQAAAGRLDLNANNGAALYFALRVDHTSIARALIEYDGPNPVDLNPEWHGDRYPPLYLAAGRGNMEALQLLLDVSGPRAVDVHAYDTAVWHAAARAGRVEVAKLLLSLDGERRIDVHATPSGHSTLGLACSGGHLEMVKLLLSLDGDRRLDPTAKDNDALVESVECRGRIEILRLLLELQGDRRVDVHARDGEVLALAARRGHIDCVRLLLSLEGDRRMHLQKEDTKNAFVLACFEGDLDMVRLFLVLEDERAAEVTACVAAAFEAAYCGQSPEVAAEIASLTGDRAPDILADDMLLLQQACHPHMQDPCVMEALLSHSDQFGDQREKHVTTLVELCWEEELGRHLAAVLRNGTCAMSLRDMLPELVSKRTEEELPAGGQPENPVLAQAYIQQVFIHCLQWATDVCSSYSGRTVLLYAACVCLGVCAYCPASGMSHLRRALTGPALKAWLGSSYVKKAGALGDVSMRGVCIPVVPIPGAPPLPQLAGLLSRQGRIPMLLHRAARLHSRASVHQAGLDAGTDEGEFEWGWCPQLPLA